MEYITTKQTAEQWGITIRRVQALCVNGQIEGTKRLGQIWIIPEGTPKPVDGRYKNGRKPSCNK
jgi:hypothetical protein